MSNIRRRQSHQCLAAIIFLSLTPITALHPCNAALPLQSADNQSGIRPANRALYLEATTLLEKVQRSTDKISNRVKRPDEIKAAATPMKTEIAEAYKILHKIHLIGDELILRGEVEVLNAQMVGQGLQASLAQALFPLRAHLGNPAGLLAAVERRVKEQANPLKQLDEIIKQKQWTAAHKKLSGLIDEADEVGLFVDPKAADPLYAPIVERAAKVVPEYLADLRTKQVIPKLREEYATLRPDLASMSRKIAQSVVELRDKKEIRWNDKALAGPDCLQQVAADWQTLDRKVAQALSVLQAIGEPAQSELMSLAAEYKGARTDAITMASEFVQGDIHAISPADVPERYRGYLDAIPILMSAVRGSPADFAGAHGLLDQFAARSPETASKVANYRQATSDYLSWRHRLAQRYLKSLRTKYAQAQPISQLLDQPPPSKDGSVTQRINQTILLGRQTPESVGSVWSEQWRGVPVTAQNAVVLWLPGIEPVFISTWHGRACAESTFSRTGLNGVFEGLSQDLLAGPNKPPLTLQAMLAVHTVAHGPYSEMGGVINSVVVDSLPDRLWDLNHSFDVNGSLDPNSLLARQGLPALVRLQVTPIWLAHDLHVWTASPPEPPRGSSPTSSPSSPPTPPDANSPQPDSQPPKEPAKSKSAPNTPADGVPF